MTSVITDRVELTEFLLTVAAGTGDPSSAVCLLLVQWSEHTPLPTMTARWEDGALQLRLSASGHEIPIELSADGPELVDGQLVKFGVRKAASGVWALEPSLKIPGAIHGFVVMHGVSDPAPWERLVLLASSW